MPDDTVYDATIHATGINPDVVSEGYNKALADINRVFQANRPVDASDERWRDHLQS